MLKKELLDILCCPACRASLTYDVKKSELVCTSCKKHYPVKDDIPILLPDTPSLKA